MNFSEIQNIFGNIYLQKESLQRNNKCGNVDFENCLHETERQLCSQGVSAANFADAFPQYNVLTHVGNMDISSANLERNDFPFWKYFDKESTAECLNDWKPTEAEPSSMNNTIQKQLSKIGMGEITIMIPQKLQEKMAEDEDYANQVMEKVQTWKGNYDRMDNGIAASNGENPTLYQITKSYCIQLDENGDVKNYIVVSGGIDTSRTEDAKEPAETEKTHKIVKKGAENTKSIEKRQDYLNMEEWESIACKPRIAILTDRRIAGNNDKRKGKKHV